MLHCITIYLIKIIVLQIKDEKEKSHQKKMKLLGIDKLRIKRE